jgi:molybdopterin-containing oxidoreductase family membrane subunit
MSQQANGALGIFEFVDDATNAAKKLKQTGYEMRAITPVFYHDLEDVVAPGRSGVRWVTMVGAILGVIGGFTLAIWTSLDWPIITGGKEIVSLPPFLIIGFECMALIGSLFNLVALIGFTGLPTWVTKDAYDWRFSQDRIGLWVPAGPERADQAAQIMKAEGAEEVRLAKS